MAFDLDGFLKELNVTDKDEETALRKALGTPDRLTALEKNQLRQSDYSKQMNVLAKAQEEVNGLKTRLDGEAAEWATLSASEKQERITIQERLDKAEQKVLAATQRITKIATDHGLDPQKVLEGLEEVKPKVEAAVVPPVDMSKFVDLDRFSTLGNFMFDLATEIPMLAQEHFDLTGERLDTRALRKEIEKRAGQKGATLDPRTVWEETFQIAAKRDEKAKKAHADEIAAAEKRGWEQARSEGALPIAASSGARSPVLRVNGDNYTSKAQRPSAPETGVRSAAQALATGKYRTPAVAGTR